MLTPSPTDTFPAPADAPCRTQPLPALASFLAQVPDTRKRRRRRYLLPSLLCLMLVALLAGRNTPAAIAEWGRPHPRQVMRALGFHQDQTPSASTLHELLKGPNWSALERQLRVWAEAVLLALGMTGEVALAADGKTLRGSMKQVSEIRHPLSVMVHGLSLTLSHEPVGQKTNEITALPTVLSRHILSRRVVTVDALLAQRQLATQIVTAGADYAMAVKGNQPALQAAIAGRLGQEEAEGDDRGRYETSDRGHGRFEWREITVVSVPAGEFEWPGAQRVKKVQTITCSQRPCSAGETPAGPDAPGGGDPISPIHFSWRMGGCRLSEVTGGPDR